MPCGGGGGSGGKLCNYRSKAITLKRSRDDEQPISSSIIKVCVSKNVTENDRSSTPDGNLWNKLDDGMVETVLARIPTADIFRCLFVCKRWDSIIHSSTFSATSNDLFDRRPWFLIFNQDMASVVYDMEVSDWRRIQLPLPHYLTGGRPGCPAIASGGLMCFRSGFDSLTVCNPLTGLARPLPKLLCVTNTDDRVEPNGLFRKLFDPVRGVAMHLSSKSKSYKVFVAFGRWPYLCLKMFSSEEEAWTEFVVSKELTDGNAPWPVERSIYDHTVDWDQVRKKGAVIIGNEGQVMVYFITLDAKLLCFDTQKGTFFICPTLNLPQRANISLDLVGCGGRVFAVVLVKVYRSVELCIWEFDHKNTEWKHIATMPPNMSQAYRSPTRIDCSGNGDYLMVSAYLSHSVLDSCNQMVIYSIRGNTWVKLPPYLFPRPRRGMAYTFSFMPDINAKV